MANLADSLVASSSRPLGLAMRADLTARRQTYQGRSYWVVKEPIGLKYFRFQDEEFAVLNMMRDNASLEDIKEQFEDEFAPHKITYQDLQQFIGTLHRSGLVVSDAPGQGQQLMKRGEEREGKELLGKLSNILAIRFKGIDPEWLLDRLYPWTRWLFTTAALMALIVFGLGALLLIGVQFDVFRARLPAFESFFGPKNWLMLGCVLGVTKIIHEFGHGLLCKHYGGECHEMGVMFLVLTPCLYCNVSDSWMLPNKYHRAAIGAGGIYLELIMATIATYIWWFTEPGLLNHLALRVMFICSISTVLFNGNPLLRFDGYYILSDLIEIPNLRTKASKILQKTSAEVCLGLELPDDPFLPQNNRFMFGMYTVAAVAYRWFVFCSILFFLNAVFEPYGLQIIGRGLALMGLFGLVVQPLWKGAKFLHIPGRMDQVKWPRAFATLAIASALIFLILMIPIPRNIRCTLQIEPKDSAVVYVDEGGIVEELHVQPGDSVKKGDPIARLSSRMLVRAMSEHQREKKSFEATLEGLRRRSPSEPSVMSQIPSIQAAIQGKERELREQQQKMDRLIVRAPQDGVVMAPPLRPKNPAVEGELVAWSGSLFDRVNSGMFLQPTDVVCQVGDPNLMEAVLAIDQADVDFVEEGQEVKILFEAVCDVPMVGKIEEISVREMQRTPPGMGNQAGGGLATTMGAAGNEIPLSATYQARVPLEIPDGLVKAGYRGQAKIRAGKQTIGNRIFRYLSRTFHFDI